MPYHAYEDSRLSATQLKVYCFINTFRGDRFYFTNDQLADMFGAHPQTISKSINRLEEYEYIRTEYEMKAGGGQIRFIVNQRKLEGLSENAQFDSVETLSSTKPKRLGNGNKVNGNKVNERYTSLTSLKDSDFEEIANKYSVSTHFVKEKYDDLTNYCESRGKKYKNYKATLRNWVKRDAPKNRIKKFVPQENHEIDPNGLERIRKMRQDFGL